MPGKYGSAYNITDELAKAPGTTVDAGVRAYRNVFDFAASGVGGTTNALIMARIPRGSLLISARYSSDQNLSGSNQSVGNATSATKYSAAAAGGAANATKRIDVLPTALDNDALTEMEEVLLTPAANWPASGILVTIVEATKR